MTSLRLLHVGFQHNKLNGISGHHFQAIIRAAFLYNSKHTNFVGKCGPNRTQLNAIDKPGQQNKTHQSRAIHTFKIWIETGGKIAKPCQILPHLKAYF